LSTSSSPTKGQIKSPVKDVSPASTLTGSPVEFDENENISSANSFPSPKNILKSRTKTKNRAKKVTMSVARV
jgi:hypothetical protein